VGGGGLEGEAGGGSGSAEFGGEPAAGGDGLGVGVMGESSTRRIAGCNMQTAGPRGIARASDGPPLAGGRTIGSGPATAQPAMTHPAALSASRRAGPHPVTFNSRATTFTAYGRPRARTRAGGVRGRS